MIKCIGTKIAAEVLATDSKPGGIWIPETAKENRGYGRVVAVGDKCRELKGGETVVLPKFGGCDIEIDGVRHAFVDEGEVLGVVVNSTPEARP